MFKSNFDTIYCPPVNSSGDIYHIATYLIMCRVMEQDVPTTVLYYDNEKNIMQAKRSKWFLNALGFVNVFLEQLEYSSGHAPVRSAKAVVAVQAYSEKAVDQKTTTSLISYANLMYGKSLTNLVREFILDRTLARTKGLPAYQWANERVNSATKALRLHQTNFVVLNLRNSKDGANASQNLTDQQLKVISKSLAKEGCALVILDVGSTQGEVFSNRYSTSEYANSIAINAFPEIETLGSKYSKFPHIQLLQQFSRLDTFKGVIGNTSGTLDIAAFMGIRSLCIHRFKAESTRNIIVPYQDLRILLQANIMSVFDNNTGLKAMSKFLSYWLSSKQLFLYHALSEAEKIKLEEDKFNLKHCERKCFINGANGTVANKIFKSQYVQLQCDQKLSSSVQDYLDKRVPKSMASLLFSPVKTKDDLDLKTIKTPLTRSSSSYNLRN